MCNKSNLGKKNSILCGFELCCGCVERPVRVWDSQPETMSQSGPVWSWDPGHGGDYVWELWWNSNTRERYYCIVVKSHLFVCGRNHRRPTYKTGDSSRRVRILGSARTFSSMLSRFLLRVQCAAVNTKQHIFHSLACFRVDKIAENIQFIPR